MKNGARLDLTIIGEVERSFVADFETSEYSWMYGTKIRSFGAMLLRRLNVSSSGFCRRHDPPDNVDETQIGGELPDVAKPRKHVHQTSISCR